MNKTRNIGLDMARVAAIALVWIGHSGLFSIGLNPKVMEFQCFSRAADFWWGAA